jgi:Amt family ammonium transporter
LIGGLDYLGFNGVGAEPNADYAATIPHSAFAAFQMMFAVITPALITGAFVERVRFKAVIIFAVLWSTFVYSPVAHWVWGVGGLIRGMGALDFAGGTVVHVTAGMSALAFALVIRKRRGFGRTTFEPHSIPMTVLGAGLLWAGWFGFNGGSALGANGLAVTALVNTNTAAAAAALVWALISWRDGKPGTLGIVTGAVVGLVAITPAAGFVTPVSAMAIGAITAPISYYVIKLRQRVGLDESLDVLACHGTGGLIGGVLTGVFATTAVNSAGANGLLAGNAALLGPQILGMLIAGAYSFIFTFVVAKVLDKTIGIAVSEREEEVGLDISEHGERAYA